MSTVSVFFLSILLLFTVTTAEIIACGANECRDQTIICTASPCTIECMNNYACYNSTIICGTNQCDILCSGHWGCEYSTIDCSNAVTCNVSCTENEACEYSHIIEPTTLICGTSNSACQYSTINCSTTNYCNIHCTGWYTCAYSTINAVQNISCSGDYSCFGSDINCIADDLCDIHCSYQSCKHSHIKCLQSNTCIVNCSRWHACSYALLDGPTHMICDTADQFSCYNSTINCNANECNFICNGHTACKFNTMDCSQSDTCIVQCAHWNSCSFSTIIGVTDLLCSGVTDQDFGCHESTIICNTHNDCDIVCDRDGCSNAMIQSPNNYHLSVTCTDYKSCNGMNVYAQYASELYINKCIAQLSCIDMNIFCPSNYNGNKKCFMEGNQYFSDINVYAIYGWDDVSISDLATNYGGSMHCGINYDVNCTISTTSWLCDDVLHICNHPPTFNPTKIPTNNPTYIPTYIPTHIPTDNPTPAPTFGPTSFPSPIPTFTPTLYPTDVKTTSLICAHTSDEFTASFIILFDYIENENNLSNQKIKDIINNITNTFIEETIATRTDCKLDTYDSTSNINGKNVNIDILACFECDEIKISVDVYNNTKLQKDFIETFERETNVLIVEVNSTIIQVNIKEPEKQVIDTTNIHTTYGNVFEEKKKYENDVFITVMIIFAIIIGFCIVCFVSCCVYKKRKHMIETNENEKEGQSIAMINMSHNKLIINSIDRVNSSSHIQTGEDIEREMRNDDEIMMEVNNDMITIGSEELTIPYKQTKGEHDDIDGEMLSTDDIIIGDDEETPNDSNDTDSIIIGDDEQTLNDTNDIIIGDDEETQGTNF